jgi:hypothetical protein
VEASPVYDLCCVAVPTFAVYPFMLVASIQMYRARNRTLALAASILALLPLSPIVLLGFPIGVWALMVLANPDVKALFGKKVSAS